LQSQSQNLQDYIRLTGPTGKIYEEIMSRLASQFSDNQVIYKVERSTFRKKEHLDLSSYYLNNGNEVSYQACSSGQKTILDINFLSKIVTRMGLLVMDEFLKHLDAKNHDICIDMLKEMNIGCILLSSHMESVPAFNNKSITLELNESGVSKIQMK
jgi:ABC-type lipoprotein export system ATPase subunit